MGVDRDMVDWCDICGQDPITLDDRLKSVANRGRITRWQVWFGAGRNVSVWVCSKCKQNLDHAKTERFGDNKNYTHWYRKGDVKFAIAQVEKDRAVARLKGRRTVCP